MDEANLVYLIGFFVFACYEKTDSFCLCPFFIHLFLCRGCGLSKVKPISTNANEDKKVKNWAVASSCLLSSPLLHANPRVFLPLFFSSNRLLLIFILYLCQHQNTAVCFFTSSDEKNNFFLSHVFPLAYVLLLCFTLFPCENPIFTKLRQTYQHIQTG